LEHLATPQIFAGPDVKVQSKIVEKLEKAIAKQKTKGAKKGAKAADKATADRWDEAVLMIGGIELGDIPKSSAGDAAMIKHARFTDLQPNALKEDPSAFDLATKADVGKLVVANTLQTMIAARQIEYLRKSGVVDDKWKIVVEVHYYRRRRQDVSQFHKDTLGQTLFVNLNYHIGQDIAGPEYVVNPMPVKAHDDLIGGTLPPAFLSDLAYTRKALDEPTEIGASTIPAYGVVAFVDEAIHHMTPKRGHRSVSGGAFAQYLKEEYSGDKKATIPPEWTEMASKSLAQYTRREFAAAGMNPKEIARLLEKFGGTGFTSVSIPLVTGARPSVQPGDRPPLKRQMSELALADKLAPEVTGDRRFFRTWVRVVPR
jgi:hypothetical protein